MGLHCRHMIRLAHLGVVAVAVLLIAAAPSFAQQDAPETLYKNGVGQFAAGNYAEAARFFRELITQFGREPSLQQEMEGAYYAQGCALYNLGQFAEAVEVFTAFATQYPQSRYRDEALYRIGAAHQALEAYEPAVKTYADLVKQYPRSDYAEDALFQVGVCRMLQDQPGPAVDAFKDFMASFPDSDAWAQAGAFAARSLFDGGKLVDAVAMLQSVEQHSRTWNVVTYCNLLAFEIGDAAFDNTEYELALKAYRRVKTREAVLRRQQGLVKSLQAELDAFNKTKSSFDQLRARFRQERRLNVALAQSQELLKKLESLPDYDAGLFHRIGRCFFNTDRYWEARVAFTRVVEVAKDDTLREAAHFDLILVLSRLRRFDDLIAEADRYLDRYDPEWKRN